MPKPFRFFVFVSLFLFLIILTACQPAPSNHPSGEPAVESPEYNGKTLQPGENQPGMEEQESPSPVSTPSPNPTFDDTINPTAVPTDEISNNKTIIDQRLIEFEFPQELFYGDSDVIRLSLIPEEDGYVIQSEFPDHQIESEVMRIDQIEGYQLVGSAQINSLGFDITPNETQVKVISANQTVHWRWTILAKSPGIHRMTISLQLEWTPDAEIGKQKKPKVEVFSKAFEVNVRSFFGLNRKQSFLGGFGSLVISGIFGILTLFWKKEPIRNLIKEKSPDKQLKIETKPKIDITQHDILILQAMFSGYGRILIEREFLSGYSGARTLLILPIHPDGKRDAEMIVKIGIKTHIHREYQNYLKYVKHTLPPMTARIQQAPISIRDSLFAAVMYTFVAEPGKLPKSLGSYLQDVHDPLILERLFDTFGPNWWYQNSPYIYHLSQEFDKKLPSHLHVIPVNNQAEKPKIYLKSMDYEKLDLIGVGDLIYLGEFTEIEHRGDGKSFTLIGKSTLSNPPMRVRWLSDQQPKAGLVRVVQKRDLIYEGYQALYDIHGLPDPWEYLKTVINETIEGTRSIIHGDLNIENILIGAGGFIWLIDFSETREGPPVFDIAHLAVEFVAHLLVNELVDTEEFLSAMENERLVYLTTLEKMAGRCVKAGTGLKEYYLALLVSSLGALKYENLSSKSKHFLYVFAAKQAEKLTEEFPG